METFSTRIQVRWADIDPNRHLRHSVYYDYGALCRMEILSRIGLTTGKLEQLGVGPILFREEAIFRKEIVFEDTVRITAEILRATPDYSRWSIRHYIIKEDDSIAATINVDGAWIDLVKRRLAVPDPFVKSIFDQIPKSKEFEVSLQKEAKSL